MVSICVCVFADEPVACFLCFIVHSMVVVGFDLMSAYIVCTYTVYMYNTCSVYMYIYYTVYMYMYMHVSNKQSNA